MTPQPNTEKIPQEGDGYTERQNRINAEGREELNSDKVLDILAEILNGDEAVFSELSSIEQAHLRGIYSKILAATSKTEDLKPETQELKRQRGLTDSRAKDVSRHENADWNDLQALSFLSQIFQSPPKTPQEGWNAAMKIGEAALNRSHERERVLRENLANTQSQLAAAAERERVLREELAKAKVDLDYAAKVAVDRLKSIESLTAESAKWKEAYELLSDGLQKAQAELQSLKAELDSERLLPTHLLDVHAIADQRDALREALEWVFGICDLCNNIGPYKGGSDLYAQTSEWCCWGCAGVFISKWPSWTEPKECTFPHEKDCKYIKSRAALQPSLSPQTKGVVGKSEPKAAGENQSSFEDQYYDLIMQVERVHKGETRHETAKRYIHEAENQTHMGEAQNTDL